MSSTAIVRQIEGGQALAQNLVNSFENQWTLAKVYAEAGFFNDIRSASQAMVKIQAGSEIGVPPNAAMNGIHIIKGKTSIHYALMAALIRKSGIYDYEVVESTEKRCELEFFGFRRGEWRSLGRSAFDLDQAKKAGTQNLDKWPEDMLFARAMSRGTRKYCAEIFLGPIYVPDEMGAVLDAETGEVLDAQPYPTRSAEEGDFRPDPPAKASPQNRATGPAEGAATNGAATGEKTLGLTEARQAFAALAHRAGFLSEDKKLTAAGIEFLKERGAGERTHAADFQRACDVLRKHLAEKEAAEAAPSDVIDAILTPDPDTAPNEDPEPFQWDGGLPTTRTDKLAAVEQLTPGVMEKLGLTEKGLWVKWRKMLSTPMAETLEDCNDEQLDAWIGFLHGQLSDD